LVVAEPGRGLLASWDAGTCPLSIALWCSSIDPRNLTENDDEETGYNYRLPNPQAPRWCVRPERLSALLDGRDHGTPPPGLTDTRLPGLKSPPALPAELVPYL